MFQKTLLKGEGVAFVVSVNLIKAIGLEAALVLQKVHDWLNPEFNKNVTDGKRWVYNTYEQWQKQLPFWSERTVRRIFASLEKQGLLLSAMQCHGFRKIKFYTINYAALENFQKTETAAADKNSQAAPSEQNWPMGKTKSGHTAESGQMHLAKNGFCSSREPDTAGDFLLEGAGILGSGPCGQNQRVDLAKSGFKAKIGQIEGTKSGQMHVAKSGASYKLITTYTEKEERKNKKEKKIKKEKEFEKNLGKAGNPKASLTECEWMVSTWDTLIQVPLYGESTKIRLTPERATQLGLLLDEIFDGKFDGWTAYCLQIQGNRFLMGKSKGGGRVTFDWAINSHNARRVLEGQIYDRSEPYPVQGNSLHSSQGKTEESFAAHPSSEVQALEYVRFLQQHCIQNGNSDQWFLVCQKLVSVLGKHTFEAWFKDIVPEEKKDGIILGIRGAFLRDYIQMHYLEVLLEAIKRAFPNIQTLAFRVGAEPPTQISFVGVLRQSADKDLK